MNLLRISDLVIKNFKSKIKATKKRFYILKNKNIWEILKLMLSNERWKKYLNKEKKNKENPTILKIFLSDLEIPKISSILEDGYMVLHYRFCQYARPYNVGSSDRSHPPLNHGEGLRSVPESSDRL